MEMESSESFRREDYYLAQIAAEIRRSWIKNKKSVKLKDFLINFFVEDKSPKGKKPKESKLKKSKRFWLGNILNRKGKKK